MPAAPAGAGGSSPVRSAGSPKGLTTDFTFLSGGGEKLRLCAAAVTRIDGIVVGTYAGSGSAVSEDLCRQVAKVLALRCAQLPTAQWETKFSETTCHAQANFFFEMDKEGRIFVVAVDKAYPVRLAYLAVEDLRSEFNRKLSNKSLSCPEDGCKAGVRELGAALAKRFEDVNAQDQLSRVQGKVDGVREQMQVNITQALAGMKTTEQILERSEELKASALVFKKNATALKKMMWWQKTRFQLMIVGGVLLLVLVLVLVLVLKFKK